jgi:hypothetical protein
MNLPVTTTLEVSTPGVRLTALSSGKWRVTTRTGTLLGNLEEVDGEFRAMRFSVRYRGFRALGTFRTATDAADALRFS